MSTTILHSIAPTSFIQSIFDTHTQAWKQLWTSEGRYLWDDGMRVGQYRGAMMHCLAYLNTQDDQAIEMANCIIVRNYDDSSCPFACNLAIEILQKHEALLRHDARELLIRYLKTNLSFMSSADMQCHGYNDNHPHKSAHALVCAGEWLDQPAFVQMGLQRLEQSLTTFSRNDYPSEYNSPNYQPVSLKPLAELAEQTQNAHARELARELEAVHWKDLAHHFDARVGLPTGPFTRGNAGDYYGLINHTVMFLAGLYPERFDFDVIQELYVQQQDSRFISESDKRNLPFYQSHLIWFMTTQYHADDATTELLFADKAGQTFTGHIESGTMALDCPFKDGPKRHILGPRQGNITTYYGKHYNLGTAQYSWLNGCQAHGMIACVNKHTKAIPDAAAYYYTRLFYDDNAPCLNGQTDISCFKDHGEYRTVQHQNVALVFYNPLPVVESAKNIRTGIFRPLKLNHPHAIFVGDHPIDDMNYLSCTLAPITINEGNSYVGITPLRLTDLGQARHADMEVRVQGSELAILISSFEGWSTQQFSYEQIMQTYSGFAIEVQDASDWLDFETFRKSLLAATVEDEVYSMMRRTRYRHKHIQLSASYGPFQSTFRYSQTTMK